MYTLLSGVYRYLTQIDEYSVVILGLDNAGKTVISNACTNFVFSLKKCVTIVYYCIFQTYLDAVKLEYDGGSRRKNNYKILLEPRPPTVGLNIGKIKTSGVALQFWDLGGQTELQSLWEKVGNINKAKIIFIFWVKMFIFHFQYYSECHAVIYVIDSHDRERIQESRELFGEFSSFFMLCLAR